ncbi:MAG: rhamnulokinase [Candidatus Humimicrobiaceae bacterium]
MHKKNYLIFDFGASSGRASVAEFDSKTFSISEVHRFENIPVAASGTLYWDILRLYSELKNGLQKAVKKYDKVNALGIDTWGNDFGFIDKNGKLISNPIHYRDPYRNSVSERLYEVIPAKELFKLTGGQLVTEVSLFNLYALKLSNAVELKNACRLLMIPDIFNYFLTGELINEFTIATTTLMFNPGTKKWAYEIFEKLNISKELFKDVVMPGFEIGNLSASVCRELETRPLKVILPPTHDTASAVTGIPIQNNPRNWGFISMGTWCIIGIETSDLITEDGVIGTGFFNEGGAEDLNLFVKDINGLWIIQQCRAKWISDLNRDIKWEEIVNLASCAEQFKSFIDVDFPVFCGTTNDMPGEIINYCKNIGQQIPSGIGEIARCVYESLALRFRYDLERLENFSGTKIEILHLVGGGTENKLLCQWTANSTRKQILAGPTETTSVGNLLLQLKATGEIKNIKEGRQIALDSSKVLEYNPQNTELWDEAFQRYKKII